MTTSRRSRCAPTLLFSLLLAGAVLLLPAAPPPAGEAAGEADANAAEATGGATKPKAGGATPAPIRFPYVAVDRAARVLRVEAELSDEASLLEFLLINETSPEPALQRGYESAFVTKADPAHIHLGLMLLGLRPAALPPAPEPGLTKSNTERVGGERIESGDGEAGASAPRLRIEVEWEEGGEIRREPATRFLYDRARKAVAEPTDWAFTGSYLVTHRGKKVLAANLTYVIVSIFHDETAVANLPYYTRNPYRDELFGMEVRADALPPHFRGEKEIYYRGKPKTVPAVQRRPVTLLFRPASPPAEKREEGGGEPESRP